MGSGGVFLPVGLPLACRNQVAQAVIDVEAPRAGTAVVALEGRNQADVGKAELGLVALPRDLKDNVRAIPLGLVFDKVQLGIRYMPYDLLRRYEFGDLLGGAVDVLVPIGKFFAGHVGAAVDLARPPAANVI